MTGRGFKGLVPLCLSSGGSPFTGSVLTLIVEAALID